MNPNPPGVNDPHRRAKHAIVRLYAGLLGESENEWLTGHLAECDACRGMADAMEVERAGLLEDGRHLPSSLMARWGTEYSRLHEVPRGFVDAHLKSCEQCRRGLQILGHPYVAPASAAARRVLPSPSRFLATAKARWLSGGALIAAAGALLMYMNIAPQGPVGLVATNAPPSRASKDTTPAGAARGTGETGQTSRHGSKPDQRPPQPEEQASLAVWTADSAPASASYAEVSLDHEATRGADEPDTLQVFRMSRSVRTLKLLHPATVSLVEDDQAWVVITVHTPSGRILQHRMKVGELRPDLPLRLDLPGGVERGVYEYSYVFGPEAHEPPIRGEVRIELR